MRRVPIIVGNWKMHTTVAEAVRLVQAMLSSLAPLDQVERVICPPFVSLVSVAEVLRGSHVKLGAQNVYCEEKGAFTGEVSPMMLQGLCDYVIIGHSERRHYFQENDKLINRKVRAALAYGLKPILCIGESHEENAAGQTKEVVERQLSGALNDLEQADGLVIAYEPIWSIGTGITPEGSQVNGIVGHIRGHISKLLGSDAAQGMRIQYGGSVTAANIAQFLEQPEIDGALVGGASLKAEEFVSIVERAARAK